MFTFTHFSLNNISMKKAFLISLTPLLIMSSTVFAESWDDFSDLDRAWDGQKSITNKEFEDAMTWQK